ncbi:hypothetical protein [Paenibacillus hunanensis]|uniref:TetR family transcriptional regulator n=1 Tax=Paenibacillus hunanensis TaxID=539262 RepID=A0ABU1IW40_9BACL|nr:hypothetical protein [Paenibacillus hunanensis]MDR6243483.1 hypothetical protein [Paenibacillus hunanensis]GGI98090.1 hypothetical protein GCM10008022_03450 [Paenibacillus hunanensis]
MNKQTNTQGAAIPEQVEATPFEALLPELRVALALLDDVYLAADPKFKGEVFNVWQSLNGLVNKHSSPEEQRDQEPIPYVMTTINEMFETIDPAATEDAQIAASSTAFALGMYVAETFGLSQKETILDSLVVMIQAGMSNVTEDTSH